MSRYVHVCSILIEHHYYVNGENQKLQFLQTRETAALVKQRQLILRQTQNGLEVWQDCASEDVSVSEQSIDLTFDVISDDPWYAFRTDWDAVGQICVWQNQLSDSCSMMILGDVDAGKNESQSSSRFVQYTRRNLSRVLFSVHVSHVQKTAGKLIDSGHERSNSYVFSLPSKLMHWKYFFSGAIAKKKLQIVDLDAKEDGDGIVFVHSKGVANADGKAMVSLQAMPMQAFPNQRFQLREESGAGRILIKRLPNASMVKVGKERGNDGSSFIVAEIYIHQ
ncbi:hypothetical protein [Undibacterium flavidum]|uniref:Uncharacterized protein n=1 Tax=Undibacterium flavidum TaxID=2762297 RepID=A0ABR6YFD8_9BURK|nr:hypothetical protein [Undibacterium flavidum]MBC3875301.1 hypothetical protein [Undibacterium flavidum]